MRFDEHGRARCENPRCGCVLEIDHVTLLTTEHVRRFCTVDCVAIGYAEQAYINAMVANARHAVAHGQAPRGDDDDC
jgi:hypothetical protein